MSKGNGKGGCVVADRKGISTDDGGGDGGQVVLEEGLGRCAAEAVLGDCVPKPKRRAGGVLDRDVPATCAFCPIWWGVRGGRRKFRVGGRLWAEDALGAIGNARHERNDGHDRPPRATRPRKHGVVSSTTWIEEPPGGLIIA